MIDMHKKWFLLVIWLFSTAGCALSGAAYASESPITQPVFWTPTTPNHLLANAPQDNDIRFQHLSIEQGLSQSSVHSILQDDQGFVWFGTDDGLNRFDGSTFAIYRHDAQDPNSLSSNTIRQLLQDRDGFIWIGTVGGGLNRLDRSSGEFTHFRHDPQDPDSLSANDITALFQDQDGNLWVGTPVGLDVWQANTASFLHYAHEAANPTSLDEGAVTAIYQDRQGNLWIGTESGLDRYTPETGQFSHITLNPAPDGATTVYAIVEDQSGALWLGTDVGVIYFQHHANTTRLFANSPNSASSLSDNHINTLFIDLNGILWIGAGNKGLDRLDPATGKIVHYRPDPLDVTSLSANQVVCIFEDRSGLLWFGTIGGGVEKFDRRSQLFTSYTSNPGRPGSLSSDRVTGLAEAPAGNIWIGTQDSGLNLLDPQTGEVTQYRHDPQDPASLSSDEIWDIYVNRTGTTWVGTGNGLDLYSGNGHFAHFTQNRFLANSLSSNIIYVVNEDQHGNLWVGTSRGLNRLSINADPPYSQVTRYYHRSTNPTSLSNNTVWAMLVDHSGTLWVGTRGGGVSRYNPQSDNFTVFRNNPNDPSSLSNNIVPVIFEDRAGILWVGTFGGLNRFEASSQTFKAFTERDGLPNSVIYGIQQDEQGYLWLSTNNGIARFDPQNNTFLNFNTANGLLTNEFNLNSSCQTADGHMFFGGSKGVAAFYPQELSANSFIPPVVITGFSLFNQVEHAYLPTGKTIQLSYEQNFVSFDYAALDYAAPEKNLYQYKMDGIDKDWVQAGTRRHADYPNLKPGVYTFRVRGSNSDGVWNETGTYLNLTIRPPYWGTPWFQAAVLALAFAFVLAGYRMRMNSIENRSRELEQQVEERTRELAALSSAENRRAEQFRLIVEVGRRINPIMNLSQTLEHIARQIQQTFGYYHVGIGLVEGDEIVYRVGAGELWDNGAFHFEPSHLKIGLEGLTGWVAAHGKQLLVPDVSLDPRYVLMEGSQTRSELVVPIFARGDTERKDQVIGILDIQSKELDDFDIIAQSVMESLAHLAGIAIDNAQRFTAEMRRAEQFRVISEVSQRIASIFSVSELLSQLAILIQEGFNYYHVGIGIIEGDEIVSMAEVGGCCYPVGLRMKFDEGCWGHVARSGEIVLLADTTNDPRYKSLPGNIDVRSILCVPLSVKSTIIGVISAESDQPDFFDQSDIMVLQSLAHQAAVAIENARLFADAQQGAVTEERNRLARELHDSVTQSLYGVTLYAQAISGHLALDNAPRALEHLKELQDTAQEALAEMRLLIHELRPSLLVEAGLAAALQARLMAVEERAGLKTEFRSRLSGRLLPALEAGLYSIAREALNNALKHAQAKKIMVYLLQEGNRITLEISDNGLGFDPATAQTHGGMGLPTMYERAVELNGVLTIVSQPGAGAQVRLEINL